MTAASNRPATKKTSALQARALRKVPTGISGFDEVTGGGLPLGRTSLVCGAAGCGKTLFGLQFLVRGALDHGEPGAFIAFEESRDDLIKNVASLGFDLVELEKKKLLSIDHIRVERTEIEENGEYDLEGLFIRLGLALDTVKAKRLVIDTLETVFGGVPSAGVVRSELRRLFAWLKERGVTTVLTGERGEGTLTRHGLEEYVSDCVILLDNRVHDQVSTRRLRIVKYRGSTHGSNEYPFLIDSDGLSVVPITASDLEHRVSTERVDTGIPALNAMFDGSGYFRASTVLVSGTAGCGKSSIAAHFAAASCQRGERCLYVSYEESATQIERNMRSIGLDLGKYIQQGTLKIIAHRPTSYGLEGHLALLHKVVLDFAPASVVIDPIGTMAKSGQEYDAHLMLVRLIDFLKNRGITTVLTNLTHGGDEVQMTEVQVSSLVDTWLLVRAFEHNGERTRGLFVLKSRGMNHSNQVREFLITSHGIELQEPYVGAEGVLTGTARVAREAQELSDERKRRDERLRATDLLERRRALIDSKIAELRAEFAAEEAAFRADDEADQRQETDRKASRVTLGALRGARGATSPTFKPPTDEKSNRKANKHKSNHGRSNGATR